MDERVLGNDQRIQSPSPCPKSYGAPVRIDAGEFFYQDGERRTLPAYDIDRVEVTIAQYAEFLRAVGLSTEYDHPNQAVNKGHSNPKWIELYQAAVAGLEVDGSSAERERSGRLSGLV